MNSKLLGTAVRCSDCVVRDVARGISSGARRQTFSTSSTRRKHGAVPAFTEASSPELTELLNRIRNVLIMPAHLSKQQQDLIYKAKHKKVISSEPVTAVLGDEEFTLAHINTTKDVPSGYKSLWAATRLMKEKKDWDNLPRLLHGLNNASALKFDAPKNLSKKTALARILGQAGRQDVLLECIRRSAVTGLALREPSFVSQVMFWFQMKALDSDWDPEITSKVLTWAEMVVALLDNPAHTGGQLPQESDPRTRANVIGILLELAAVRANKHLGGQDIDGKVAQVSERLLLVLGQTGSIEGPEGSDEGSLNHWVSTHMAVLYGMKQALVVLDSASPTATQLKTKTTELDSLVQATRKRLAKETSGLGRPSKSTDLYKRLFPEDS